MKACAILLLLALAFPALAQPYYVSPHGNDTNSGTLEKHSPP